MKEQCSSDDPNSLAIKNMLRVLSNAQSSIDDVELLFDIAKAFQTAKCNICGMPHKTGSCWFNHAMNDALRGHTPEIQILWKSAKSKIAYK